MQSPSPAELIQEPSFTREELAEKLRVHPDTVDALIRAGKIAPDLRVGKQIRIPLSAVNSLGA